MGRADYLALGDWNCACWECGKKRKASSMRKHWKGYYVCSEHWEPREAQDFVRAVPDNQTPPWMQPQPVDSFTTRCSGEDQTAIPRRAIPGCAKPDYTSPFYDSTVAYLD